jgi:hypothetical protein
MRSSHPEGSLDPSSGAARQLLSLCGMKKHIFDAVSAIQLGVSCNASLVNERRSKSLKLAEAHRYLANSSLQ